MGVGSLSRNTANQQQHIKQAFHWSGLWEIVPATFGVIWLLLTCYPVLYMLMTSLRPVADFLTDIPWQLPSHPTTSNYTDILSNDFGLYFANTAFVTIISVLLILVVSLFAAYSISRIRNRFTQAVFSLFLVGLAIPLQATIIPIYAMITDLHLYDTLFALILPSVAFGLPLSVLVLVTYIRA